MEKVFAWDVASLTGKRDDRGRQAQVHEFDYKGIYKTHLFGKMPIKFGVKTQCYPIRPDSLGEEFNIRVVIAPIIPALF